MPLQIHIMKKKKLNGNYGRWYFIDMIEVYLQIHVSYSYSPDIMITINRKHGPDRHRNYNNTVHVLTLLQVIWREKTGQTIFTRYNFCTKMSSIDFKESITLPLWNENKDKNNLRLRLFIIIGLYMNITKENKWNYLSGNMLKSN